MDDVHEMVAMLARDVCEGKRNMLQVERYLYKRGWSAEAVSYLMQSICEKISERKKGNG